MKLNTQSQQNMSRVDTLRIGPHGGHSTYSPWFHKRIFGLKPTITPTTLSIGPRKSIQIYL